MLLAQGDDVFFLDSGWQVLEVPPPLYSGLSTRRRRLLFRFSRFPSFAEGTIRMNNLGNKTTCHPNRLRDLRLYVSSWINAACVNSYVSCFVEKDVSGTNRVGYVRQLLALTLFQSDPLLF